MNASTIISGLMIIALIESASAISIGVSPATLTFDNMIRGGYSEAIIGVGTSGDDRLKVGFSVSGPIKDWMSFNETEFVIEPHVDKYITVYVRPPLDAAGGNYTGEIFMGASPAEEINKTGGAGVGISGGITIGVTVSITGQQIESYKISDLTIRDIEVDNPISVIMYITNRGNVRVKPKIHVDIYKENTLVKSVDYIEDKKEILPTRSERISFDTDSTGLEIGNYLANVSTKENYTLDDFNIFESGGLTIDGVLEKVTVSQPDLGVGEKTQILGIFENTGSKKVLAKLKVKALIGSELIDTFEGGEVDVAPGEKLALEAFYTPQKSGKYTIQVSVVYSKKITPPKEVTLNVSGFNYLYLIILVIIIGVYVKRQKIREILRDYVS